MDYLETTATNENCVHEKTTNYFLPLMQEIKFDIHVRQRERIQLYFILNAFRYEIIMQEIQIESLAFPRQLLIQLLWDRI
jgi:hypothetical protein